MSITSIGYDGSVNEANWAALSALVGAQYAVQGFLDCQVQIGGTGDRAVTVRVGTAFGSGVMDTSNAAVNLNAGSVTSGARWDTVVLHRDWSSNTSIFRINAGGATKQVTRTDSTPGTLDDQPVALIRMIAGSTAVQEVVDLRMFSSKLHYVAQSAAVPFILPFLRAGASYLAADNAHLWVDQGTQLTSSTFSTAAVDLDAASWQALPLAGGGALVAVDVAPAYTLNRGRVQFKGSVKRSNGNPLVTAGGADAVLATVPSGVRPSSTRRFMVYPISTAQAVRVEVGSDGTVLLKADLTVAAVALDVISYLAEQ